MGDVVLPVTVRAWPIRNRIPPEYWPGIIEIAAARALDIDADWLMRTTPARKRPEAIEATGEERQVTVA